MLTIKIIPNDYGNPPGKLADAEIFFAAPADIRDTETMDADVVLHGLKLTGFAIWTQHRAGATVRNVTFPARSYSVNGERRTYALLRQVNDDRAPNTALTTAILAAYDQYVARLEAARG